MNWLFQRGGAKQNKISKGWAILFFQRWGKQIFPEENENAGPEVTQVMTSSKILNDPIELKIGTGTKYWV